MPFARWRSIHLRSIHPSIRAIGFCRKGTSCANKKESERQHPESEYRQEAQDTADDQEDRERNPAHSATTACAASRRTSPDAAATFLRTRQNAGRVRPDVLCSMNLSSAIAFSSEVAAGSRQENASKRIVEVFISAAATRRQSVARRGLEMARVPSGRGGLLGFRRLRAGRFGTAGFGTGRFSAGSLARRCGPNRHRTAGGCG